MFDVIGRFMLVAFAFLVSVITALIMMVMLGARELGETVKAEVTDAPPAFDFFIDVMSVGLFTMSVTPGLTIIPALIAIIIGEVARIRSAIFYMLAGGLAVLAIPFLYETGADAQSFVPSSRYLIIFSASGFVAGFLYWVIAGRRA